MNDSTFHLAIPARDLGQARRFYIEGLGFAAGRESPAALIMNMGGHQVVAQLSDDELREQEGIYPRHFGLIFDDRDDWQRLVDRARRQGVEFYREPMVRYPGQVLEHDTFFLRDPSGNLLEFKYYHHRSAIFGETHAASVGDVNR
jgi:extradiol dioxygenase family protein